VRAIAGAPLASPVDEILTVVNIALGNAAVATCATGDANDDGQITVEEILMALNNALSAVQVAWVLHAKLGTARVRLVLLWAGPRHGARAATTARLDWLRLVLENSTAVTSQVDRQVD